MLSHIYYTIQLFINKRCILDKMKSYNASIFAIFFEYSNPRRIFSFFNLWYFIEKILVEFKSTIPKIWQILNLYSLDHFIKHKPLVSKYMSADKSTSATHPCNNAWLFDDDAFWRFPMMIHYFRRKTVKNRVTVLQYRLIVVCIAI